MNLYQAINNIVRNENILESVKVIQDETINIDLNSLKESVENFQYYENLGLKTKALEVLFNLIILAGKDVTASVDKLILEGHKIPAIREHRRLTGDSLHESKIFVEERMRCLLNQR